MNGHFVYIFTDNNRRNMRIGTTDDFQHLFIKSISPLSFEGYVNVPKRLVHVECLASEHEALHRCNLLQNWTKIQREKLIRKHNPNWLDIGASLSLPAATGFVNQAPRMKLAG